MKQTYSFQPYNFSLTVYLSSWFPFIGSGWFVGFSKAFVKYTYYQSPLDNIICWDITAEQDAQGFGSTHRTMMHEYSHLILKHLIGSFHYWSWCIKDYIRFWIKHDLKPIEIRVEEIRKTLINPY